MVLQKMQDITFAKSVDRAQIVACEEKLGFPLKEYIGIVLGAMQTIAIDLGFES
jgi:predicted hydrolase (HD superfamily)